MADNLQISKTDAVQSDYLENDTKEGSAQLQTMGRNIISALYMLVRSVKMYDPDNAVFDKPLNALQENMNAMVARDGRLELMGVKQSLYLNGVLLKVDASSLENVQTLLAELRSKDVGGLTIMKAINIQELKNFIWLFSKDQSADAQEDGLEGKKLLSMQLTKWSKLKEKLDNEKDESGARLDRKKYALTCYGRAIFFIKKYMTSLRSENPEDRPINTSKALRLIQDFVDISVDQRAHFLGLSTMRIDSEYLAYHQVNTCLSAIVFGQELGLTKNQMRDLGYIALFHEAGMGVIPDSVLAKTSGLTDAERAMVTRAPLISVRNILRERSINRATLLRLVTTFEHKAEFGTAVRDSQGNIQMIIPRANLGAYAKIISICSTYDALTSRRPYRDAYGPEVALLLMWTEMRNKFDPELLKVFMKVMAIAPLRVMTKRQQSLAIGMI